jgi:hypothetical protein
MINACELLPWGRLTVTRVLAPWEQVGVRRVRISIAARMKVGTASRTRNNISAEPAVHPRWPEAFESDAARTASCCGLTLTLLGDSPPRRVQST